MPPVPLDFLPGDLRVKPRSEWTDVKPRTWRLREAGKYDRLTIHHTGEESHCETGCNAAASHIETILRSHLERNYGDVGYHMLVDASGRVWEGRSLAYEGAHVLNENERNIGVVFLGNFETRPVPKKQLATLNRLVAATCRHFDIKPHRIFGHRELGRSLCPGTDMCKHVGRLKRSLIAGRQGILNAEQNDNPSKT